MFRLPIMSAVVEAVCYTDVPPTSTLKTMAQVRGTAVALNSMINLAW
jgi:hypothetical protein